MHIWQPWRAQSFQAEEDTLKRPAKFPAMLADPLCACTGGEACGKSLACGEEDDALLPSEPIVSGYSTKGGPVAAVDYEPDPTDPIDVELSWHLLSVDHAALSKLMLRRIEAGEYTIEGRHVSIHWGTFGPGPCRSTELLVSEEREDGDWDSLETPLQVYLRQALNVIASLGGQSSGAPAVARVPHDERLSFFNIPLVLPDSDPEAERLMSMKRACEEARLREAAVETYERDKLTNINLDLHRITSNTLPTESQIPPLPIQGRSQSRKANQEAWKHAALATAAHGGGKTTIVRMPSGLSSSMARPVPDHMARTSQPVTRPVISPPAMTISRLTSGIPNSTTCVRKV